jgi:hypothetical protein
MSGEREFVVPEVTLTAERLAEETRGSGGTANSGNDWRKKLSLPVTAARHEEQRNCS